MVTVPVDAGLSDDINTLLEKYNNIIIKSTINYSVCLNKITVIFCENPILDPSTMV